MSLFELSIQLNVNLKKQIMKLNLLLASILLGFSFSFAQQNKQVIRTDIKKIKLFLTSGEMLHESEIKLTKGRNKIVFAGISAFADPRSIQFTANGNYRLVSVNSEIDFLAGENVNPKITELKDSLEVLQDKQQAKLDLLSAYQAEIGILNTNRDIKGKDQNLTVEQLKAVAEFYRTRTLEISTKISSINKEKRIIDAKIDHTRNQLIELNYNENQRSNQVIILIDCNENQTITGELKYLVSDCGWVASYDLSAADLSKPINLKYRVLVYNNTGNDWTNVKLTLSTADPLLSASAPKLNPFYVDYQNASYDYKNDLYGGVNTPQIVSYDYRSQVAQKISTENGRVYDLVQNNELDELDNDKNFLKGKLEEKNLQIRGNQTTTMQISAMSATFDIENLFSCPSDAKPYMVDIRDYNLKANFTFISVPKLDQGAYVLANIAGWQELDLLPGKTKVYFAGNYVGESFIATDNVSDTLSLSLGRDPKIQVIRKLKSEMSVKKVAGSTKKDTYYYDILVKNNHDIPINLTVYDQIPLTRMSEISITTETIGTGVKNELTGEVAYNLNLNAAQNQTLELGYTIRYPKNQSIQTKQFRTVSCPKF